MAVNTKTIKRRIKSVGSTKKLTKAMEMISAVKMRKAVSNVLATRNYADLAWKMLLDVAKKTETEFHPLLKTRPTKKVGLIFITSNRGMAGGFSSKLLMEADAFIKKIQAEEKVEVEIILMGRRGRKIYKNFGHKVVAEFDKIDLTTKIEEILPMIRNTIKDYINKKYDRLMVAYTDYVSAIKQAPRIKQILPLQDRDYMLGKAQNEFNRTKGEIKKNDEVEFKFEPSPSDVLDVLIPKLVEMQVYQAILESDASEHSARMVAMRNASDSAQEIIKELNYTYNKARQSAITQEIAEIVGGAAALE